MLRKKVLAQAEGPPRRSGAGIDIPGAAEVGVTSEAAEHPVENVFDGRDGPGGTCWTAAEPGDQALILAFDTPQTIRCITLEIEEQDVSRHQEAEVSISYDGGQTYRTLLRQGYNFSPPSTTFQREEWSVEADKVTHFRLWIRPDTGTRSGRAKVTSLSLR